MSQTVTSQNFQNEVLNNPKPVMVDFYADWCGPCKMLSPVIETVAAIRNDIVVVKVNVDRSPDIAQSYDVMSIPTVIVFKNGKESRRSVGYQSQQALLELLN